MQRTEFMAELKQDVLFALRMLRRTPAFTAAALLTLALGIGANSAIFSVVHGVLLESLPYRDADRLHQVRMLYPDGTKYSSLSAPDFMNVREESRVFEQVECYDVVPFTLTGSGEPREIMVGQISVGTIALLGLEVATGRAFLPEESQPGRGGVAILSHGLWQRLFGGDANVLTRAVTLGGRPYTIVGVAAQETRLPDEAEMYVPLTFGETFDAGTARARRSEFLSVVGRARPGVAAAEIESDLQRIGTRLQSAFPDSNDSLTFTSSPLREMIIGDVRRPLFVLLGAVGFVLLVACGNVANLLLARGSARHGELAVRAALGAGRARLVRQLVTEAVVLGLTGGVLGLALAYWGTTALIAARPADIPRLDQIGLDSTVVLFTLAVALVTSLVFGMVPALQATNEHLMRGLQESGRAGGGSRGTHRVRAALVVAEMALAVVLLTGAGLLIRSFLELTRVHPGFEAQGAAAIRLVFQGERYQGGDQIRNRVSELEDKLRQLPGVTAVASTSSLPLGGGAMWDFAVEGAPPPPPDVNAEILVASVTPEYFRTIGASVRRGRTFNNLDHPKSAPVGLLNEAAVRKWFPDHDPIGKRVVSGGAPIEVVGIVSDVMQRNPAQPVMAQLFLPYTQRSTRTVRMVIRTQGDPVTMAPAIREQVRQLDPNLPIADFLPLDEIVSRSVARPRFYTSLLALFAGVALLLSATGIFGVMSYMVAQRTREISIHMALGARTADVLRTIVGRALALAGVGVVVGLVAAFALGRVIQAQLFGVGVFDPLTVTAVIVVLLISAAIASLLPARRAASVDPATAFRQV
jgi:putative ABC transport system permease protein